MQWGSSRFLTASSASGVVTLLIGLRLGGAKLFHLDFELGHAALESFDRGQRHSNAIEWMDHPVAASESERGGEVLSHWPEVTHARLELVGPETDWQLCDAFQDLRTGQWRRWWIDVPEAASEGANHVTESE